MAGTTFNLNSPRQLGQILFEVMKICEAPKKTKTGQYATDEQTLLSLAPDHEIVQRLLDYRTASKLKSTYTDALPGTVWARTGRIHTTYNQVMTSTGRLSSQDPNLQNIPIRTERGQEIRKAFVPRGPGYRLLSADYSQVELRIIAALTQEAGLLEAFRAGTDIHTATAARVFNVFPEMVTPEMRRKAKMVNFGIAYGISAFGLAQRLGIPRREAADIIAMIRDRVGANLIVDADTGHGNALNVGRTVRLFERSGANAIQLEDQTFPKRCGHLDDKMLIPVEEMVGKIKAALDARRSSETLVIARTDAIAVEGFDHAMARASRYRDAGADILFVEAPKTRAELQRIPPALKGVPLMANMVEGGKTPPLAAAALEELGFSLVIFPGAIVRVLARAAKEFYASLASHGSSEPYGDRMYDFAALNEVIGTPEMIALGKQYAPGATPGSRKGRGT